MATLGAAVDGQERFAFIHALRGVAALLVVWAHLSGFWLYATAQSSEIQNIWDEYVTVPFHIFQDGGHLGVVLFFLISGYIITHTALRESRVSFVVKRAARIFPPLALALALTFCLLLIAEATGTTIPGTTGGSPLRWLSAGFLLDGFFGVHRVLDVTWTLVVELIFYVLVFAFLGMARSRPLLSLWVMSGAWVAVSLAMSKIDVFSVGANSSMPMWVGFLILGRVIYFWHRKVIGLGDAAVVGGLAALLLVLFLETTEPGFMLTPGGWSGSEPLVSYCLALLIFIGLLRMAPKRVVQPFRLLGDVSYSLYLLHIPVGMSVLNLLDYLNLPNSLSTLIAIAVSIAVAWVSFHAVEKPSQILARKILRPRVPHASVAPDSRIPGLIGAEGQ